MPWRSSNRGSPVRATSATGSSASNASSSATSSPGVSRSRGGSRRTGRTSGRGRSRLSPRRRRDCRTSPRVSAVASWTPTWLSSRSRFSARRTRSSARAVATSTDGSTGSVRYASAPLSSPCTRAASSTCDCERCSTGMRRVRSSSFRRRQTSKPLMSGRWTSSRIRSGSRAASSSPSAPVSASQIVELRRPRGSGGSRSGSRGCRRRRAPSPVPRSFVLPRQRGDPPELVHAAARCGAAPCSRAAWQVRVGARRVGGVDVLLARGAREHDHRHHPQRGRRP